MKKVLPMASMKKLLLATSLLAMSSTAVATNTSVILDTAVTDTLTVTAKYVTPITVQLNTTAIDFGDVYTDSVITAESVQAKVTGEAGETFTYSITATGTSGLVVIGGTDTSGSTVAFVTDSATTKALNFTVGLDASKLTADTDVSETVTISVAYDAIADTVVTPDGTYVAPV
jgi:hypothetical protein